MNNMMRFYPALLALVLALGTPVLCVLITVMFGELCWPQRVGAVYVGAAVFMQGFLGADPDRFSRKLSDDNTLATHFNQSSFTVAVFGTLFAACFRFVPGGLFLPGNNVPSMKPNNSFRPTPLRGAT